MMIPDILIVDDEPQVRANFAQFLAMRLKCRISEMNDGKSVLEAIGRQEYHVILLDQRMPGIDGFTLLEHIRQKWPQTTVIMITGLAGAAASHKVERLGGIYMAKPISLKALLLTIQRELDRRGGFDYRPEPVSGPTGGSR